MTTRVYLAGPEVFLRNALEVGVRKKAICQTHGMTGVFPLDNDLDLEGLAPEAAGLRIYQENRELMESCHVLIANMTPFRGPSMDVGTAFEMGFMRGLGRPIYGYTNAVGDYRSRVEAALDGDVTFKYGVPVDRSGMVIEDFRLTDNLMLDGAVREFSDGVIGPTDSAEIGFGSLRVFERCVEMVAGCRKEPHEAVAAGHYA